MVASTKNNGPVSHRRLSLFVVVASLLLLSLAVSSSGLVGNVSGAQNISSSRASNIAPAAASGSFSFASAGDYGFNKNTTANWASMGSQGLDFVLATGDLSYGHTTEANWCQNFKASVPGGGVIVEVGGYETFEHNTTTAGSSMQKFVLNCPFSLPTTLTGTYGYRYYFDYPSTSPLARLIMVDPGVWNGTTSSPNALSYANGSPNQQWVNSAIDSARTAGIPWIIVAMHKDCLSTGAHGCEIGSDFMNFLIQKRVDLVLQAHDHNYQRSKDLVCANPAVYMPACVVNDGSLPYSRGAGTVFLIDGTGGEVGEPGSPQKINATRADYPYFASVNDTTFGYSKFTVSSSSIQAQFVPTTGSFTDSWSISTAAPDYSLVPSPSSLTITPGSWATSTVTLTSLNGFAGTVQLDATIPQGGLAKPVISPRTITLNPGQSVSSVLNVTAPASAIAGTYDVMITATGSVSHTVHVTANVVDFTLNNPPPNPTSFTVQAGSSDNSVVTITGLNGFTGDVNFTGTVSPRLTSPPTVSFSPDPVSLSSTSATTTLTISTTLTTSPQSYLVTVKGKSGSLVRSTSLSVTVTVGPDFTISTSPSTAPNSPINVLANSTATSTVSVSSQNGFSGTVTLSAKITPMLARGIGASLSPTVVTVSQTSNGTSTLLISTTGLTSPGNYTISITGNWTGVGGSRTHTVFVYVEVSKFSLTATPKTIPVYASSQGSSTIGLVPLGQFSGTVTLNVMIFSSVPSHPTASLDVVSIAVPPGGSAILTVSTTTLTQSGTYTVEVEGTSGSFSAAINVTITVGKFTISPLPSSLTFTKAASQTSNINLASFGGFSGNVGLTLAISPDLGASGPTVSLSLTSVNLTPGGSNSSTLTVTTSSSISTGSYTVTINGTYNTLSLSTSVNLAVLRFVLTGPSAPLTIPQGTSTGTSIGISLGGFSANVCLHLSYSGIGITPSPNPPCVTVSDGGTGSVSLNIFTTQSTPIGTYSVQVYGYNGTKTSDTLTFLVEVGSFSVKTSPTTISMIANSTWTQQVTIQSQVEFSGDVNLSYNLDATCYVGTPNLPGISLSPVLVTLTPNGTSSSTLQIITQGTTTDGTYCLTITGFSGSITSNSPKIIIHVTKFTISANPTTLTFTAGSFATSTLNVTSLPPSPNGFAGSVALSATSNPPGPMASFSINQVNLTPGSWQTTVLNVTCPQGTCTQGTYALTVKGTSGPYSKSVTVTIHVTAPTLRPTTTIVSCAPSSVLVNVPSTCIVTVSDTSTTPTTPTGIIPFQSSSSGSFSAGPSCTLSGSGASASCQVAYTPTVSGTHTITGNYPGDPAHASSPGSGTVTATPRTPTTTVSCSPNPVKVNQPTTCTVNVSDTSAGSPLAPIGSVSFITNSTGTFGSNGICQLTGSGSSASCQVTYTPTGGTAFHKITANYGGDTAHSPSSGNTTLTVDPGLDLTTTSVSCTSPVVVNQASTCTSTVTDTSPVGPTPPSGTVTFDANGFQGTLSGNPCSLTGTGSSASCQVTFTPSSSGTANINAAYDGDTGHLTSSSTTPASVTVNPRPTMTSVSCAPGGVSINQPSTCSVTVTDNPSNPGTATTPSGTATLSQTGVTGSFTLCSLSGTTAAATCTSTFSASTAGTASVSASYTGDSAHGSSGGTASVTVTVRTTATTVSCSPQSIAPTQSSTCTATVTDPASNPGTPVGPTGTVTFAVSPSTIGTFSGSPCTLGSPSGGTVTCTAAFSAGVTPGTASITGTYNGDPSHGSSSSAPSAVNIGLAQTTTTVGCITPIVANQPSTCNVSVTDSSTTPTTPTGSVSLSQTGVTGSFTTCTLSGSGATATCTSTFTAATSGTAGVTASYSGDTLHGGSDGTTSVTVNPRTTSTTISCTASVVVNQASTCAVTVTDISSAGTFLTPTGSVGLSQTGVAGSFSACTLSGTTASATCSSSFTASTAGSAAVTASYPGDTAHGSSSGTGNIVVNLRSSSTTITCLPYSILVGGTSTCTTTVTDTSPGTVSSPAGTVDFTVAPSSLGGFGSTSPCTLVPRAAGSSSCSAIVTATAPGTVNISAAYTSNDNLHSGSATTTSATISISAVTDNTTTTVSCTTPVAINQPSTCDVSVSDTATTGATTPTGSVTLSETGVTGSFTTCNLTGTGATATCTTTFTATSAGTAAVNASYPGDSGSPSHAGSSGTTSIVVGDFGVTANPSALKIDAGLSARSTVTLSSNGFSGSVGLTATSNPSGPQESFTITPVTLASGGTGTSDITVTVPSTVSPGTYAVTITATSGSLSHSTQITVNVADFQVAAGPVSPSSVSPGTTGTSTLTISPFNGFTDTVTLSVSSSSPSGLSCNLSTNTVAGGAGTSNLSCSAALPKDYSVSVIGTVTSTSGTTSHTTPAIIFHIVDFIITGTSPVSFTSGSSGFTTVTVTAINNFAGTIGLSATTTPSTGLNVACQSYSLTLPPSPAQTSCQLTTTTPGSYSVNITGTTGTLAHSTIVIVNGGDFNMTGTPDPLYLTQGQGGKITVTVTSLGGFSSTVGLAASTPDPSISISPTSTTTTPPAGSNSQVSFSISTTSSTLAGNYTIAIQGNSGSLSHQIQIKLVLQDFSISVSPSNLSTPLGFQNTTIITLTSLNGFNGQVTVTASVTGIGVSPSSIVVNVVPVTPSTFTLTIITQGSHVGSYTITINARSTTIFHQIFPIVNVSDFAISANPNFLSIQAGTSSSTSVSLTSENGFDGTVSLSVTPHAGFTFQLNPQSCFLSQPTQTCATLTITAASTTSGPNTITIVGTFSTASGSLSNSATISVDVGPPASFTVSVAPLSSPINANSTGTTQVTVTGVNGFSGNVFLSASVATGSGLTTSFSPDMVILSSSVTSATSTLTISPTTYGTFSISVTGKNDTTGPSSTSSISVVVVDFSLTAPNLVGPIAANASATPSITVTGRNGFSGTVTLTATPSSGLSAQLSSNQVTGAGSVTLAVSASTQGDYEVTITASSGSLLHSLTITVRVGDFSITANPTSLNFNVGSPGQTIVTLTSVNSLGGSVTLSGSVSPSQPTITWGFSPFTVTLPSGGQGTSTVTITTGSSTPDGTYSFVITATSGPLSHVYTLSFTLSDFTISATPSNYSFPKGSQATSTVAVTSKNGFSGTVTLTDSFSGVSATLGSTTLSVSPTSPGTTTLLITSSNAQAGGYFVTVIAKSGSITVQSIVTVQVTDFTVASSPTLVTVQQGGTSSSTITVTGSTGFSGNVTLQAVPSNSGLTAQLSIQTLQVTSSDNAPTTQLTITLSPTLPLNTYSITITGTTPLTGAGIPLSRTTTVSVSVGAGPDFNIQATPISLTIARGSSGSSVVTLNSLNGFSQSVALTATISVQGPTWSFNPTTVNLSSGGSATSTLTISTDNSVTPTTYTLDVLATSGSQTHDVKITFSVQDFTVSSTKTVLTVPAGSSDSTTITIGTQGGFGGVVTFSTSTTPLSPQFGTNPLTVPAGSFATSLLTVGSSSASPGPYSITVVATSGAQSHNITLTVNVVDFNMSPSTTSVEFPSGSSQTIGFALASLGGFSGTVSLSWQSVSGLTVSCSSSVVLTSGASTIAACKFSSATQGQYSETVTGISNPLSHSVTLNVLVDPPVDFQITATSLSMIILSGQTNTTTLTLQSINNFNGTVTLNYAVSLTGATVSLTPTTINLTPGSSKTATLIVGSTIDQTFSVTVTASSGSLSHPVTVFLRTVDFSISSSSTLTVLVQPLSTSTDVTVASVDGFSGQVSLTVNSSPSGITTGLNPTFMNVPASGFGKSTISLSSPTSGDYSINITGVSGPLIHSTIILVHVTDFSIAANPSSLTVQAGAQGSSTIGLNPLNGFSGSVSLSASSSLGISLNLNPNSIPLPSANPSSTLTVAVSSTTPIGTYTVTIVASSSGLAHSATISLTVGQPADFTIVAQQSSLTVQAGFSNSTTLVLTSLNNFAGTITLSTTNQAATLNPTTVTLIPNGQQTVTLSVSSATAGPFTVTVTATSTSPSLSHSVTVSINVIDFRISGPSTLQIQAGIQASPQVTVTSLGGFSGTVRLSVSTTSPQLSASLQTNSLDLIPNQQASTTVFVIGSTANNYQITVTASSSSLTHPLSFTVTVVDFTISLSPTSVTIPQGSSATTTVTLASQFGFCCSVGLTAAVSPAGLPSPQFSVNPVQLSLGITATSILTISASASTPPGTYTVTVTGTGLGEPHTATIPVTVGLAPDFSISTNPQSITVQAGFSNSTTLTLTSVNSFTGSITLTTSTPGVTLNPRMVSLTPNGTQNSTFTITSSVAGSLTVTVTAASTSSGAPIAHSVPITVTIVDFRITGPSTIRTQANVQGSGDITLTSLGGFTGTVSLSITSSSSDLSASLGTNSVPLNPNQQSPVGLIVSSTTAAGYSVTITGTSGQLSRSFTVTVSVVDFEMTANPSSLPIQAGSSQTSTITLVSLNGFCCGVSLSASSSAPGMTPVLSTTQVPLQAGATAYSTLTITAGGSAVAGTYVITITGTASGGLPHTASVQVILTSDFSISTDTASMTFPSGASGTSALTLTSLSGFSGTVTLSTASSPGGPTLTLNPSTVSLTPGQHQSVTLAVSTVGSTPVGSYAISVTATGGTISHAVSLTLMVTPAPALSVPSSLTVNPGSIVSFRVNATDPDNTKIITLTVIQSTMPSGATFSPVTGSGTVSGILNWKPSNAEGPGDYTIQFTVSDGHVTSSAQVTVHVNGVSRSSSLPSLGVYWYAILAAGGAVAIVVVERLWRKRRGNLAIADKRSHQSPA